MRNQAVSYRQITDECLDKMEELNRTEFRLLRAMIKDSDIKDNCCQSKFSNIYKSVDIDRRLASKAINTLIKEGFVKKVKDIFEVERYMIAPSLIWSTDISKKKFADDMFFFGSHERGALKRSIENETCCKIDRETGELYGYWIEYEKQLEEIYSASNEEEFIQEVLSKAS